MYKEKINNMLQLTLHYMGCTVIIMFAFSVTAAKILTGKLYKWLNI